ncbi:MAG: DUF1587 domain-containing protein, partial [Gemmataceae bacterium]
MPPPYASQPKQNEARAFAAAMTKQLHAASLAQQRHEGRVVLRRLNRNEYETTLRDLLGTQVSVKDLLPEDGVVAGFDNVSEALDVSSVHLLRYQEAAEKAVRSVVPAQAPQRFKERRTGRQIIDQSRYLKTYLDKTFRLEGDNLITFMRHYGSTACQTPSAVQPGRYRVRASLASVGCGSKSLPVVLVAHGYTRRADFQECRVADVPPDRTIVISEEFSLDGRETVQISGWDLPSARDLKERVDGPLKSYNGRGLVIEWVEIEGPLDEFPSAGYRRLFGDVPLKPRPRTYPATLEVVSAKPREDASRLIRALLPVAFRRPVDEPLASYFVKLAHQQLDQGQSFQEALTVAYTAVFCSPHFLYLNEPANKQHPERKTQLDDYALASRLSYFLWLSLPDAELT